MATTATAMTMDSTMMMMSRGGGDADDDNSVIHVTHGGVDTPVCGASFTPVGDACATIDYALRYRVNAMAASAAATTVIPIIGVMVSSQPYTCPNDTYTVNHSLYLIGMDGDDASGGGGDGDRVIMNCHGSLPPFRFHRAHDVLIHRFTFTNMTSPPRIDAFDADERDGYQFGGIVLRDVTNAMISSCDYIGNRGGAFAYITSRTPIDRGDDDGDTTRMENDAIAIDDALANGMPSSSSSTSPYHLTVMDTRVVNNSQWVSSDAGHEWSMSVVFVYLNRSSTRVDMHRCHWRDNYVVDRYRHGQRATDITTHVYATDVTINMTHISSVAYQLEQNRRGCGGMDWYLSGARTSLTITSLISRQWTRAITIIFSRCVDCVIDIGSSTFETVPYTGEEPSWLSFSVTFILQLLDDSMATNVTWVIHRCTFLLTRFNGVRITTGDRSHTQLQMMMHHNRWLCSENEDQQRSGSTVTAIHYDACGNDTHLWIHRDEFAGCHRPIRLELTGGPRDQQPSQPTLYGTNRVTITASSFHDTCPWRDPDDCTLPVIAVDVIGDTSQVYKYKPDDEQFQYYGHVTISDTIFANITGGVLGSLIQMSDGSLLMSNITASNVHGRGFGGMVYTAGIARVEIRDSVLTDVQTTQRGDLIFGTSRGALILDNVTFTQTPSRFATAPPSPSPSQEPQGDGDTMVVSQSLISLIDKPQGEEFRLTRSVLACAAGHRISVTNQSYDGTSSWPEYLASAICIRCDSGSYALVGGSTTRTDVSCIMPCPYGGDCRRGGSEVIASGNFWGTTARDGNGVQRVYFTSCPAGYCQAVPHSITPCVYGRTGRLCGACRDGFSQTVGSSACVPNNECSLLSWLIPVVILFAICYLMFFALSSPDSNGDITILIIYYQQSGLLFVDQSLGGIVKDVLVPLLNLEISAQSGDGERSVSALSPCFIAGMTTLQGLVAKYLMPIFLAFMLIVLVGIHHGIINRCCPQILSKCRSCGLHASYLAATVKLIIFTYSSVATTTFALLHCIPIAGIDNRTFIHLAAEHECYEAWQYPLFILLFALVLFPLGVYFVTKLRAPQSALLRMSQIVFNSPYHPHVRYWQSILMLQLLCTSLVFAMVSSAIARACLQATLCLLYLSVHLVHRPFANGLINFFQFICLSCLCLVAALNIPDAAIVSAALGDEGLKSFTATATWVHALLLSIPLILFVIARAIHHICPLHAAKINTALLWTRTSPAASRVDPHAPVIDDDDDDDERDEHDDTRSVSYQQQQQQHERKRINSSNIHEKKSAVPSSLTSSSIAIDSVSSPLLAPHS